MDAYQDDTTLPTQPGSPPAEETADAGAVGEGRTDSRKWLQDRVAGTKAADNEEAKTG